MKSLVFKIIRPFITIAVFLLRYLPMRFEAFFFRTLSRTIHPSISGRLFEDSFRSYLLCRGTHVDVQNIQLNQSLPLNISLDVADYIQRRFLLEGFPDFMPILLRFCGKKTAFFDIGANVGIISLGVAKVSPPKQIFAFEPVANTFRQLEQNTRINHPEINCRRVALSDQDGEISMLTVAHDSGSSTVDQNYLKHRLESKRIRTDSKTETCPTQQFDTFWASSGISSLRLDKVAIKIDVEGHEVAVLSGMKQFLDNNRLDTLVICETHWKNVGAVRNTFRDLGFEMLEPSETVLDNVTLFGSAQDLIFHRRQTAEKPPRHFSS